jgi:hypothetical protein
MTPARPAIHRSAVMRTCAISMTAAAAALLAWGDADWWSILLATVLLACPAVVLWSALRFGRRAGPSHER